jgi:hypothetical protein
MTKSVLIDSSNREEFEEWIEDIDAARGFEHCLETGFCFRCEQRTLVVEWSGPVLVLTCPCNFVPDATDDDDATPAS